MQLSIGTLEVYLRHVTYDHKNSADARSLGNFLWTLWLLYYLNIMIISPEHKIY